MSDLKLDDAMQRLRNLVDVNDDDSFNRDLPAALEADPQAAAVVGGFYGGLLKRNGRQIGADPYDTAEAVDSFRQMLRHYEPQD